MISNEQGNWVVGILYVCTKLLKKYFQELIAAYLPTLFLPQGPIFKLKKDLNFQSQNLMQIHTSTYLCLAGGL